MSMPIELYTDGSCSRNPGPGGFGYIIRHYPNTKEEELPKADEITFKKGYRLTTNNRMELAAGMYGLQDIINRIQAKTINYSKQINVFSDSEYFCKSMNLGWLERWSSNNWMTNAYQGKPSQPVKNRDIWEKILMVKNQLRGMGINLVTTHVEGHAGNEYNEQADQLATSATADYESHQVDEEYEKQYNSKKK